MWRLGAISEDTIAFPWAKRTPGSGLEAVPAMVVALLVGKFTGHASAGAIAAGAAFTAGFAVFHEALASTMLSMAVLTLGIASATLAGSLCAPWTAMALAVALIAAVNYGLLAALGPTEGWIGQQCATFVIVASYFSGGTHYAVGRSLMVLAGGGLQMAFVAVAHVLRRGERETAGAPSAKRLTERLWELERGFRGELTSRGETADYVARLALALLLSTVLYRHYRVRNGYWIPMTALLVMKPQWASTMSRGIARTAGTVLGAGVALVAALFLPLTTWVVLGLVVVCAWACYALQAVNYGVFSVFVTLYIVFLFRFGGFSEGAAAHIRLVNTAVGGGLALVIDVVWKMVAARRGRSVEKQESVQ